jgi:putative spermidine/putrescine transport system substrate-binding protein
VAAVSALALGAANGGAAAQSPELVDAARVEGALNLIALPHDWCNFDALIQSFKEKYPWIEVNELDPNADASAELEAIRVSDNAPTEAPDVIEVGQLFAEQAKAEGLLQPYKVSTCETIPDVAKDAEGYWYGNYYGRISFVVNPDNEALTLTEGRLPRDWSDFVGLGTFFNPMAIDFLQDIKPLWAGIALAGDPETSMEAILAVYSAGLSAAGGDPDGAPAAGLAYFERLRSDGSFVPIIGAAASLADETTPVVVAFDYSGLAWKAQLAGKPPIEVILPQTGAVADLDAQAISARAPHPNAAKLWMEHLYSDAGQLLLLAGFCHPVRFTDLAANGKIPADLLGRLPARDQQSVATAALLQTLADKLDRADAEAAIARLLETAESDAGAAAFLDPVREALASKLFAPN